MNCTLLPQPGILPDNRPLLLATTVNQTMAASATQQLCSLSGVGSIVSIGLFLEGSGADAALTQDTQIQIMYDGASAPGQFSDIGTFFMIHGLNTGNNLGWCSTTEPTTAQTMGARRTVNIPFGNGIIIKIVNGSSSVSASVYAEIEYRSGQDPNMPANRRWYQNWTGNTAINQDAVVNLLPTTTGIGEIEAIMLLPLCSTNYGWFEGTFSVITDGNTLSWPGTEPHFGGDNYFNFGNSFFSIDELGAMGNSQIPNITNTQPFSVFLYRNRYRHVRMPFFSSAQITWMNGNSAHPVPAPGNIRYLSNISYYK